MSVYKIQTKEATDKQSRLVKAKKKKKKKKKNQTSKTKIATTIITHIIISFTRKQLKHLAVCLSYYSKNCNKEKKPQFKQLSVNRTTDIY